MSGTYAVAVVGAGPAGFFAAAALLALKEQEVRVDMFERLPTPWGLVRAGVAPDHPKIKSVSAQFAKTAAHERFRFFGDIEVGTDVTRDELVDRYDAVVYTVGAPTDRRLGVPGEDLPGSVAAVDFVGWYNGHPDFHDRGFDLEVRRAVVIGNGNVALDVARILSTPPQRLASTDIADRALDVLRRSTIEEVVVVGRRGAAEAAFTTAEVRELAEMTGATVQVDPADVAATDGEADLPVVAQRNLQALREYAAQAPTAGGRRISLRFLRSPVEIRGVDRVEAVVLGANRLEGGSAGNPRAVDTGGREVIEAGLVLRAVGYRGAALSGVPFDERRGVIPNTAGRVDGGNREYVAGWAKRGPSGIIGTNKRCAVDTVRTLVADIGDRPARGVDADVVEAWLRERCPELVDLSGWAAIDAAECRAGEPQGRPRVKLCTRDGLRAAAGPVRV